MPDWYDRQEAQRLHDDASALVEEAWCEGDHLVHRLLFEAELAGADVARDALVRAIEQKKIYYLDVSALWAFMAQGVRSCDMAKIRGAYAGLRTATMKELSRDPVAQTLNPRLNQDEEETQ